MSYANIRVLVVDTNDSVQKIFRPILTRELGFISDNIYEANNGRKALGVLESVDIDLVISEWDLPEISGIDLLKKIRRNPRTSSLPFLMATSNSDQQFILKAAQAQVSQYIVKPFSANDFNLKLKQVLEKEGRQHARHELRSRHEVSVMHKGNPISIGKIVNVSKGGLLAQLAVHRGMAIYDRLKLQIAVFKASGEKEVDSVHAELIRIERVANDQKKTAAYYAFMFIDPDPDTKKFITGLMDLINSSSPVKGSK